MLSLILSLALQAPPDDVLALEIQRGDTLERVAHRTLRDWLVYWHGHRMAPRYAQLLSARELGPERGVVVDDAAIARALEEQIEARVESAFSGDEARWLQEIESLGRTVEGFRRQRRTELEEELLLEGIAHAARDTGEEALRAEWERTWGEGGRRFDVRTLGVKFHQPSAPPGTSADELKAIRDRARRDLERRVQALRDELARGADFDALLAEHGTDPATKSRGGRFRSFPPPGWPSAHLELLEEAAPGDVLEPVFHRGSFHVVRLEGIVVTPFAEVRDEARQRLLERPITAGEMQWARSEVAAATDATLEPALYAAPGEGADDDVVMVVNAEPVTRRELGLWLVRTVGERDAALFALVRSVAADCAARGLVPTEEAVRARIEQEIAWQVDTSYTGDRERWLLSLGPGILTEEDFVRMMIPVTKHNLMTEALMTAERVIDERELRRVFEDRYGEGGRRIEARWIRWDVPFESGMTAAEAEEVQQATLAEAAKVRRRLAAGEDFATLARRYSTDPATRDRGGSPGVPWVSEGWSEPVRVAFESLGAGDLSEPILDHNHVWLFEIVSERRVSFEDVAEELRAELEATRPPDPERAAWLNVRSRGVTVRRLDGLYL